jgi:EAL domain-containing protein (putative c-di-GMP-specific phosphodiesterase class I)/CHASE2 domain-containing sensor protein
VSKRTTAKAESPSWKLLLWTAVAGLLFGLIGFGELPEDLLRIVRNSVHSHKASGEIVLVRIDDEAIHKVGRWPWPRRYHAELVDELSRAGAKRILYDVSFFGVSDPANDRSFAEALQRSGKVTLSAKTRSGRNAGEQQDGMPLPIFAKYAKIGSISWQYNYSNAVWRVPYSTTWNGQPIDSFASLLAKRSGRPDTSFVVDYSIDPQSVPSVSAGTVLEGKLDPSLVRGKDVVVGATTNMVGDVMFVPGTGQMGGAYVHVIAAETLKRGEPVDLGWIPLFVAALALCAFAETRRSFSQQSGLLGSAIVTLLLGPALLEARLIFVDIMPGLFVLITVGGVLAWRWFRQRGLVDATSGLPNLNALRSNSSGRKQALVAARVLNYEEIVAALPPQGERQLVDQIVSRLKVGAPERTLYQGDGGIFAWFEHGGAAFGNHLDALYALFRNPARIAGLPVDLTVAFGLEVGSSRSLANRLASALVAADEAAHQGLKWKYHDPESLENASWKLSMLSQLDSAIDRGEVWVAYQPKLDLATSRIVGAEALARWTHPEKGPIAASEFVAAAEQHDRIGKLTDFVLEKAIGAAASINKRGTDFDIAVNLSARLLTDKGFTLRVAALLARNGLAPERLTLELTETAALTGSGEGLEMIARLRELGIRIAIDDYGTGLSTLDYLKKIPANEIKIDQSFVKGMVDNRSDRLMVQSTIGLAHSLGRTVVAEGVEQRDILDLLIEMQCDVAQGFAIGRPMSVEALIKRLSSDRRRRVA